MKLKIGMALRWKGQLWMCTRMDRYEGIYKAYDNSGDWEHYERMENILIAGPYVVEHFDAGDVVHRREVRAELESIGGKFFYVYVYLKITVMVKGDQNGTTGSVRGIAAQTQQAEATWGQPGGWESSWLEGLGEAGDAPNGAGPLQQNALHPAECKTGAHTTTNDGHSDSGGAKDSM